MTYGYSRHDKNGQLREGFVGLSLSQRQWIAVELGAQVTVEVLPDAPHLDAPSLIQAIEIEVDFLKSGYQSPEAYSLHDMAMTFLDDFKRIQMTKGQPIVFVYCKEELRGVIKSVALVEEPSSARKNTGIIFTETIVTFSKRSILILFYFDRIMSINPIAEQIRCSLRTSNSKIWASEVWTIKLICCALFSQLACILQS